MEFTTESSATTLHGRRGEREVIADLLTGARSGRSGALLLRGDSGLGKSALLDEAARTSTDFYVLRAEGVEAESQLPFAGLHQLLRPLTDRLDRLPEPQAHALAGALGLVHDAAGDRFLISVGMLSLLSEAAANGPVLCCVDDVQWLDPSSLAALAFTAQRLDDEGVVLLCTTRDRPAPAAEVPGMRSLRLAGLDGDACHALLDDRSPCRPAPAVADRLARGTGGNPLALAELAELLTPEQLTGQQPLPDPLPLSSGLERAYAGRVHALPEDTQRLLLIAAADEYGDAATLARAAIATSIDAMAAEPAENAGLVRVTETGTRWRHPLVRSAVYQQATSQGRRAAHRALAEALAEGPHQERRAWHRAAAAAGPDEQVATELTTAAKRARRRSGYAAAAATLERAARLSVDDEARAWRLTGAAHDAWRAGTSTRALALLDRARALAGSDRLRGWIGAVRGEIGLRRGMVTDSYATLLAAATRLAPTDGDRALQILMAAGEAAGMAGDHQRFIEVSRRASALCRGAETALIPIMLNFFTGTAAMYAGDLEESVSLLREVVTAGERMDKPRPLIWAGYSALHLNDIVTGHAMASRAVDLARAAGAMAAVPTGLEVLVGSEALQSNYSSAAANALEGLRLAHETGQNNCAAQHLAYLALIAAFRGQEVECGKHASETLDRAAAHGLGMAAATATWALAIIDLGMGRNAEVAARLHQLSEAGPGAGHPTISLLTLPYWVDAVARTEDTCTAHQVLTVFEAWAEATGSTSALALVARCKGLLTTGADADGYFTEALRLHRAGGVPFDRAYTQLLYGERLRRDRRRTEARTHLRAAIEVFERLGAGVWERRARTELRATGETLTRRDRAPGNELTPQELQIAQFVSRGATNREVAAQLFLSPRTVDYHLRKVFTKLGISSRVELARVPLGDELAG